MILITESNIEQCMIDFENEDIYEQKLEQLHLQQMDLCAFIDQDNQSLLTQDELGILEYLIMTIYYSAANQIGKPEFIKGGNLEEAEDKNWDVFNSLPALSFAKIMDKFFESYLQEDLLALVEDTLQPDENQYITNVGREIILIVCKSVIDVLDRSNN